MASKKVGVLIKEARTAAGLTQEKLAQKVDNCTASDISKAERGEKELTSTQLRQIAKATGVTQSSLLNAPKGGTGSGKPSSSASSPLSTPSGQPWRVWDIPQKTRCSILQPSCCYLPFLNHQPEL